jgi:hypothetical protein
MKANPGGHVDASDVIGRDKLIASLWRTLEQQSLVLCAERRMGKTCIIDKMVAEAPLDKLLPVYRDLEGMRTPFEFAEMVFNDVKQHLSQSNRTMRRVHQFLEQIGGTDIGGVLKLPDVTASHWKVLLTRTMEDLAENQDRTVIFFWDEVPLMLYNIKQRGDEGTAMELLDMLRSFRQMHPGLRMVFTGSIGIHNVITALKRRGYANDPTNDMHTEDVPPLSSEDAQRLARLLLKGEKIKTVDVNGTARAIADAVDGIPYYIHHVVSQMRDRDIVESDATVREIVNTCLTDPLDRWHMSHYQNRISTYYTSEERPFALGILDAMAVSDEPLMFDEVFNRFKSRVVTEDSEMARHILMLLQRDHYVIQQTDGKYSFRFPLIQRWWRLHRG